MDISEHGITIEAKELRAVIRGELGFRRCPDCQGEGDSWVLHYSLADDPLGIEDQKEVGPQFAADFLVDNYPEYSFGECYLHTCNTCHGVGYVPTEEW